jgi:hypothetical protein
MFNIRKYVTGDMEIQGVRFVLAEYAIGIFLPFVLGLITIVVGQFSSPPSVLKTVLGYWFVAVAINYVPLFIYAILFAREGTIKEKGAEERAEATRDRRRQVIIAIPFLVVILALVQEIRRQKE